MRPPLVSVVVPTHDGAGLLPRAVESALAQTFAELEVVVVDDGPSAATARAVGSIGDERVHYLRHARNRGPSAARNTGIAAARGRYVGFLDDDDLWLPRKLELQVPLLEAGAAVVHSLVYIADRDGNVYERPSQRGFAIFRDVAAAGYPFAQLLCRSSFQMNALVVRRELLERIGGFDESLRGAEDVDLVLRLRRAHELELVDEPLVKYCLHDRNTSGRTLADGWRRLAEKELARLDELDAAERRQVEAFLQMRLAQSEYILGRYHAAVRPAVRARALGSGVLGARELAKYVAAGVLPGPVVSALRDRRRRAPTRVEPDPWIDLRSIR